MSSKKALVVRGGWPGHSPVEATDEFRPFLQASGFDVRIEESTAVYEDVPWLQTFDLIVQCVSMGEISAAGVTGLREAVARGTGLAGWHGGIVDSYRGHPEYLQLVGGQFLAHPPRPTADPGRNEYFVPHRIDIVADHEIVRGVESFELVTEQYWVLTDAYDDVLATTTQRSDPGDSWHRPITCPAVWTRQWGAGRVFVATPGHDLQVLRHPAVRAIIENGLLWSSR